MGNEKSLVERTVSSTLNIVGIPFVFAAEALVPETIRADIRDNRESVRKAVGAVVLGGVGLSLLS